MQARWPWAPPRGNIIGIYNGVTATAPLTVTVGEQLAVAGIDTGTTRRGWQSVSTGTVTLNGLAPSGGQAITLSSDSSLATVQSPVWVNEGSSTKTFTINTNAVTNTMNANITATLNGTQTAVLAIAPSYGVASVTVNPGTVLGGANSTGTVTMAAPAPPGGTVVSLSSSNSAAATVPSNIIVTAGSLTATFTVTTNAVTANANVTINHRDYAGASRTAASCNVRAIAFRDSRVLPEEVRQQAPSACKRRADWWDGGLSLQATVGGNCTADGHGCHGQYYCHVCSEHDRGDQPRDSNHRGDIQRRQPDSNPYRDSAGTCVECVAESGKHCWWKSIYRHGDSDSCPDWQ